MQSESCCTVSSVLMTPASIYLLLSHGIMDSMIFSMFVFLAQMETFSEILSARIDFLVIMKCFRECSF